MQSLVVKISNPETVHAIAKAAKRQGTTPEAAALELLKGGLQSHVSISSWHNAELAQMTNAAVISTLSKTQKNI